MFAIVSFESTCRKAGLRDQRFPGCPIIREEKQWTRHDSGGRASYSDFSSFYNANHSFAIFVGHSLESPRQQKVS
jgi:hypothetical protein